MRTRHSLTAAVVALVAILVGIIISLLAGGGPDAHAEEPGPAPSVGTPAPPPDPGTAAGGRHGTKTGGPSATKTERTKAGPGPTRTAEKKKGPPKLGPAKAPEGATYDRSDDGRAFTTAYESLESGTEIGRPSRTQTLTVPVTGDAGNITLALVVQGYVLTGDDSTATLTVTVNGATTTRSYRAGTDRSFTESVDVPLRGVSACRITVRVAVDGSDGYLNASTLDGELR